MQHLRTSVPEHLSSHSALSSYGLFAPVALWQFFVFLRTPAHALGNRLVSGASWFSANALILCQGSGNNIKTIEERSFQFDKRSASQHKNTVRLEINRSSFCSL